MKTILTILLLTLFLGQNVEAQFCNKPNPNFCPGNYFANGDFENVNSNPDALDDQDISVAKGWSEIWSGGSLADLYCPTSVGTGNPPTPDSGVYASMWITNENAGDDTYREGMYNKLSTKISQNTGNYSFTFKTATLNNVGLKNIEIGIYGVSNPGNSLPAGPTSETNPTNLNLFNSVGGKVVLLGVIKIPVNSTNAWINQSINFNSSLLPANGIDHILITKSDAVIAGGARMYMAFDEFCLKVCKNCSTGDGEGTWDTNTPKDCFCCDKAYNLPTVPQIIGSDKVECGAQANYSTSNCPGATTTWGISPSITFSGQGTNAVSISNLPAGTYTLSVTIGCGKTRYTSKKTITVLAPLSCDPAFLVTVQQLANGMLNINAVPSSTTGVEHYWGVVYNGTYPNCTIPGTPILLNDITSGQTFGAHVTEAGVFAPQGMGTGINGGTNAPYGYNYQGFPNNSCFKITHYVKCCGVWKRQTQFVSIGTSNARVANGTTIKPDITIGAVETVK